MLESAEINDTRDVPHAPVVYFEDAANMVVVSGEIIAVTLTTRLFVARDGKTEPEHCAVAHLRTNRAGLASLCHALNEALAILEGDEGAPEPPEKRPTSK